MTEKRIDYLARMIINHKVVGIGRTKSFLRAVAYEGWREGWEAGIDEMLNESITILSTMYPSMLPSVINKYKNAAKRLKDQS